MPVPISAASWWGSLLWLVGVAVVAFGIAWLSGTRLAIRKGPYIPALLVVSVALGAGYVAWVDVGFRDVLTARWGWGVAAGLVIGLLLMGPASRQPVERSLQGSQRTWALAWEGVVYGTGEGLLLSAVPAFIGWQMVHSLGWSGTSGAIARWTLPLLAAAAVVVIHHLGYWNFRNRILVPVTLAMTVQTLGFLVTASWLAPVVTHIVLHAFLVVHGSDMPPNDRPHAPTERFARAA